MGLFSLKHSICLVMIIYSNYVYSIIILFLHVQVACWCNVMSLDKIYNI